MTAILKQMDDMHYAHHISTFKTRQDIIVSVPGSPASTSNLINNAHYIGRATYGGSCGGVRVC